MPITFKIEALKPADVILSTQAGKQSSWVRCATRSPYSHAMLCADKTTSPPTPCAPPASATAH